MSHALAHFLIAIVCFIGGLNLGRSRQRQPRIVPGLHDTAINMALADIDQRRTFTGEGQVRLVSTMTFERANDPHPYTIKLIQEPISHD